MDKYNTTNKNNVDSFRSWHKNSECVRLSPSRESVFLLYRSNISYYMKYYKLATDIEVNNTFIKSRGKVTKWCYPKLKAEGNIILSPSQGI